MVPSLCCANLNGLCYFLKTCTKVSTGCFITKEMKMCLVKGCGFLELVCGY